ncbi:CBS domain-containing protein [Pedobacter sp.]|nr:CBS domain-containing protein [Candidatus Saccharibacteria bacterium]
MTSLDISLSVLAGLLAAILVAVRAVSLAPKSITAFELRRRLDSGDGAAMQLQAQRATLPRLLALRHLLEVIVSVVLVLATVTLLGWFVGGLIAIAVLIATDIIAQRPWAREFVSKQYKVYEARVLETIAHWRWLGFFSFTELITEDMSIASKPELRHLIGRSQTVLSHDERQHLESTLSFSDVIVKDIMTPRSMIDNIDQRESIGPLVLDQLHKTGHSRFPVIDVDVDHVVGMLYLHDLVTLSSTHKTAKGAMQPDVYYVHEDHSLEHALHAFLRTHHHLFIVVNKFRETVGLLSLEDVIESLLGHQVIDEFDEYHDLRKVAESNPRKSNEPKGRIDI